MYGDREGETHVHAAGVPLDGRVDEFFDLGEGDDLVEVGLDLGLAHAEDGAVEEDVLAAGQFGVEAGADFEERADSAAYFDLALGRGGDAREDFEQRALARAVAPDDADDVAPLDFERKVFERPEGVGVAMS